MEAERNLPNGELYAFEEMLAATLNLGGDTEKVTAQVIELLKSEQEIVRYRSAKVLARIGRKAAAAVPRLTELLNDSKVQIQTAALEALAAMGPGGQGLGARDCQDGRRRRREPGPRGDPDPVGARPGCRPGRPGPGEGARLQRPELLRRGRPGRWRPSGPSRRGGGGHRQAPRRRQLRREERRRPFASRRRRRPAREGRHPGHHETARRARHGRPAWRRRRRSARSARATRTRSRAWPARWPTPKNTPLAVQAAILKALAGMGRRRSRRPRT